MQVEIMEKVFDTFNFQRRNERRNVSLFLDNTALHPTSLIDTYSKIKIVFLPKNKRHIYSCLMLESVKVSKINYRKKLMRYVIARINDDLFTSETAKGIDILQAIIWVADAWNEVSVKTIKICFATCGITEQSSEDKDDIVGEEFNALFNELVDSECDITAEEYVDFDLETCSSLPAINSDMVDWKIS